MIKERIKNTLKLLFSFLIFFYLSIPFVYIMAYLGFGIRGIGLTFTENMFQFVVSGFTAVFIVLLYGNIIRNGINKLNKDSKNGKLNTFMEFFVTVIALFGGLLIVNIFTDYLAHFISKLISIEVTTANNQSILEELALFLPFLLAASAIVFAPIEEELVFRGGLKEVIKNKWVFISVSGLIFGLMHITDSIITLISILLIGIIIDILLEKVKIKDKLSVSAKTIIMIILTLVIGFVLSYITTSDINECLNSFSYVGAGLYLAFVYVKTDNILYTLAIHMLTNILAVFAMFAL